MNHECSRCGYRCRLTGDHAGWCPVCWTGRLLAGVDTDGGFTVVNDDAVAGNQPAALRPVRSGTEAPPGDYDCFQGITGKAYARFIEENTTLLSRFPHLWVPDAEKFAWLSPYTGNEHNRAYFTQLVIATVARAVFRVNLGRLPRLVEPFVGSGQVFLNAHAHGTALNAGVPPFVEVVAGDLNHYLIAAYRAVLTDENFVPDYLAFAERLDSAPNQGVVHQTVHTRLNESGQDATSASPDQQRLAAFYYIWLVNRARRGASLNQHGGVTAGLRPPAQGQTRAAQRENIRRRESAALSAMSQVLGAVEFSAAHRDFRETCALARPNDLVFMDCPFPAFTNTVSSTGFDSANTYGIGDDGKALQPRIITEAQRLIDQGTTVILCDYATPALVREYRKLIQGNAKREYLFTYRPRKVSDVLYLLAIMPGRHADLSSVPRALSTAWTAAGGGGLAPQFQPQRQYLRARRTVDR